MSIPERRGIRRAMAGGRANEVGGSKHGKGGERPNP